MQATFRGKKAREALDADAQTKEGEPEAAAPVGIEEPIQLDIGDATQDEIDAAATKMQATFRGKKAREALDVHKKGSEPEATDPVEEPIQLDTGDATQQEIDAAATKMQATFRGKKAREALDAQVQKKAEE